MGHIAHFFRYNLLFSQRLNFWQQPKGFPWKSEIFFVAANNIQCRNNDNHPNIITNSVLDFALEPAGVVTFFLIQALKCVKQFRSFGNFLIRIDAWNEFNELQ